ncbi:serine hydrolase domain-containing protein [Nocardia sp. NPDC127606]|uniref:serine hydrolase domain-containing protein n=1 Tax=Nocardia sp. NPDC127606 TaxID=3345406 RepID=UPI0036319167
MRRFSILAAMAVVVTLVGCSSPEDGPEVSPTENRAESSDRVQRVRDDIDAAVASGVSGVIATLTENGKTTTLAAGVADRASGSPIPTEPPQQVRVGSVSKSFVAAIVLQLVAERRIQLDEPIDTYLPGLIVGDGVDGRAITVRQILQHRSGLPEFADSPEIDEYRAVLAGRTFTPTEELALALRHPAKFEPGARFTYTNTNYLVAAMMIERITGRPYVDALQDRIIRPLGLTDTYLPATGEHDMRGPHPHGYAPIDGTRTDVTRIEPSVPWAAGALVSTGGDLNRYFLDLVAGKVVAEPELQQMLAALPTGVDSMPEYGLGVMSAELSCGTRYIGHTGGITGYATFSGATTDGRAATIVWTEPPSQQPDMMAILTRALCP